MFINLFVILSFACGSKTSDSSSSMEADLDNGESIYQSSCMACHPNNGYDVEEHATDFSDEELESIITEGAGGMPAQSSLSESDVRDVIAYIRATFG